MAFLSVFIPAFNEEQNLAYKVAALSECLAMLVPSHERLIVDDASRDHTGALAEELARDDSRVRVFHHKRNQGIGRGFVTALANARGEWLILIPADLAMDINDLHEFFDAAGGVADSHHGTDVVVGLRSDKRDYTSVRYVVSWVNIRLIQILFGMRERQFQYICLYRMKIFADIQIEFADSAFFHPEILIKTKALGYRLVECVVGYVPRRGGRATGANPRAVIRTLRDMFRFWLRWVTRGAERASRK